MSSAALLLLASLDSGTIASGTHVIDLYLSQVSQGACTLEIDAIDYEAPPNSWDVVFDADDYIGDTYLIDIDVFPGETSCFLRSGGAQPIYMCDAGSIDRNSVRWEGSLVVPPGVHDITVWSDGGSDVWQPIGELELQCGSCDTYGDFDGNGQVDAVDLVQLLTMWGQEVEYTAQQYLDADAGDPENKYGGDGIINGYDLAMLQSNWGPTCAD